MPFVAGALVSVLVGGRPRIGRLYVAFVPLALYAIWWLGWGHTAESTLSLDNVLDSPKFVFDAASQAMASLLGLATPLTGSGGNPVGLNWGRILLVIGIGLAVWRFWRLGRVPRPVWVVLAIGGVVLVPDGVQRVSGLARADERPLPISGRRVPAADRSRGPARGANQHAGPRPRIGAHGPRRAQRPVVPPPRSIEHPEALQRGVARPAGGGRDRARPRGARVLRADVVFSADRRPRLISRWPTPTAHLPTASPSLRRAPQRRAPRRTTSSSRALGIKLGSGEPGRAQTARAGRCQTVAATPTGATGLTLGPGEVTLRARPGASAEVLVARFGDGFPVSLGPLVPGSAASVKLPVDRSPRPWRLGLRGAGGVTVCEEAAARRAPFRLRRTAMRMEGRRRSCPS